MDLVPLVESGINNVVFVAIAVVLLWAAPDMHQLAKEPERFRPDYTPTAESLPKTLTEEEMRHYLDYCTELLSLVVKTAALCAERSSDSTVLDTVSDVETLTTDMSTKIFQKVAMLGRFERSDG